MVDFDSYDEAVIQLGKGGFGDAVFVADTHIHGDVAVTGDPGLAAVPCAAITLGTDGFAELLDRQTAQLFGIVAAVGAVPTGHVGSGGLVHTDGTDARQTFQLIPEIVHGFSYFFASFVYIFYLNETNSRTHLMHTELEATHRKSQVFLKVLSVNLAGLENLIVTECASVIVNILIVGDEHRIRIVIATV